MVDTSQTPSLGFMQIVQQRDAATLLPIIQQHLLPGTTVHSDEWSSYRRVARLPNVRSHATVNHSFEFVSSSGIHTQNVESYWNRVKTKLKCMKGCHEQQLPSYLDEFMYRKDMEQMIMTAGCQYCRILPHNILCECILHLPLLNSNKNNNFD